MIHIIVATNFEAKPLIENFDLKRIFPSKTFDIFVKEVPQVNIYR